MYISHINLWSGIYPDISLTTGAAMATSRLYYLLHILCNNPAPGTLKICPNLQTVALPAYIETDS